MSLGAISTTGLHFDDRYRTVSEARIADMLELAGWVHDADQSAAALQTRGAIGQWIAAGLAFRTTPDGRRLFDPVEVWSVMKRLGRAQGETFFRHRYVTTGRRRVEGFRRASAPDQIFAVEFSRTFETHHLPPDMRLRLRLPLPLDMRHPTRSVEILGDATDPARLTQDDNRLELRCRAADGPITVKVRTRIVTQAVADPDGDMSPYLRAREGSIVVSARVRDLAQALARPGGTVAQAVRSFWLFLIERFTCGPVHYDQIDQAAPCDRVLDTGCYDCRLGAAVFVALCRTRDIPARLIGGHVLYRGAPFNHFWAEYRCPTNGWTPVDFLGWDLSGGGEDPLWRNRFFGQVDARLVTDVLPHAFVGAPGVPMPKAWHLLQTPAAPDGIEIALTSLDGRRIYTDVVRRV